MPSVSISKNILSICRGYNCIRIVLNKIDTYGFDSGMLVYSLGGNEYTLDVSYDFGKKVMSALDSHFGYVEGNVRE